MLGTCLHAETEDGLPGQDETAEEEGAEAHARDAVDDKAAKEGQNLGKKRPTSHLSACSSAQATERVCVRTVLGHE